MLCSPKADAACALVSKYHPRYAVSVLPFGAIQCDAFDVDLECSRRIQVGCLSDLLAAVLSGFPLILKKSTHSKVIAREIVDKHYYLMHYIASTTSTSAVAHVREHTTNEHGKSQFQLSPHAPRPPHLPVTLQDSTTAVAGTPAAPRYASLIPPKTPRLPAVPTVTPADVPAPEGLASAAMEAAEGTASELQSAVTSPAKAQQEPKALTSPPRYASLVPPRE